MPTNLNIASTVNATVYVPTQSVTVSPGVTFTNGSTGTAGPGNFSGYVIGSSISADNVTWYQIGQITGSGNNQTITFGTPTTPAPFYGATTTVTTYYTSPCIAGQNCAYTYPFSVPACTGTSPCTTTVTGGPTGSTLNLGKGVYAIKAFGVDSSGVTHAVNVNPNLLDITGTLTDTRFPHIALVPVYPVGTGPGAGETATCPLNISVDPEDGDVWTTNGNGATGLSCANPSDNISYLPAASNYAPTVINNPLIDGAPEGIVAETVPGTHLAWVTVPSIANGIFVINTTGGIQENFVTNGALIQYPCPTPRGVDVDTSQVTIGQFFNGYNPALVTCFGTITPNDSSRMLLWLTPPFYGPSTIVPPYYFNDLIAQPLAVRYGHAFAPNAAGNFGGATAYNTDDGCNHPAYVTRTAPGNSQESAIDLQALLNRSDVGLATTRLSITDDGPFAMGIDGFGTTYASLYTPTSAGSKNLFNEQWTQGEGSTSEMVKWASRDLQPTAYQVTVDDNYQATEFTCAGQTQSISGGNVYYAQGNVVTRNTNSLSNALNQFYVGQTQSPGPRGVTYDPYNQKIWVANSAEGTLSAIGRDLFVFANNNYDDVATPCFATANVVTGSGFDMTTLTNNTISVAGYIATIAASQSAALAAETASQKTAIAIVMPNAPVGTTGPVVVSNQNGSVVSLCTHTF